MIIDPSVHDILIRPGALWSLTLTLENNDGSPIDLTDYTVFCEIRTAPGGELLATPTSDVTPAQGQINLTLDPDETMAIGAMDGTWDVLIGEDADHTNISYVVGGQASCRPITTQIVWTP